MCTPPSWAWHSGCSCLWGCCMRHGPPPHSSFHGVRHPVVGEGKCGESCLHQERCEGKRDGPHSRGPHGHAPCSREAPPLSERAHEAAAQCTSSPYCVACHIAYIPYVGRYCRPTYPHYNPVRSGTVALWQAGSSCRWRCCCCAVASPPSPRLLPLFSALLSRYFPPSGKGGCGKEVWPQYF